MLKRSLQQIDEHDEEMVTFGQLVVHYGGWRWDGAIIGAKNTAAACAKLGGRWIEVDPWSKLLRFRLITKKERERFTRAWETLISATSQMDEAEGPASQASGSQASGSQAVVSAPAESLAAVAKAAVGKPAAKAEGTPGGKVPTPSPKKLTDFDQVVKKATTVRAFYVKIVKAANDLLTLIEKNHDYLWARGSEGPELSALVASAEEKAVGTTKEFLVDGVVASLRKGHRDSEIQEDFELFISAHDRLQEIGVKTKTIMNRHRAGVKPK